jgi:hypothetical protein
VEMTLIIMRRITRTMEGDDHSLMTRVEDGVTCLLESFCGYQFSLSLVQIVSVVLSSSPSNASRRRRPSPFNFLLLNLEPCMKPELVVVSV